jgi:hypothetical protein
VSVNFPVNVDRTVLRSPSEIIMSIVIFRLFKLAHMGQEPLSSVSVVVPRVE